MSESKSVSTKDEQAASPNAAYAFGPGGLLNTPGLGIGGGKRRKRKGKVVNAMVGVNKKETEPASALEPHPADPIVAAVKELFSPSGVTQKAVLPTGKKNDLPDSAFLYVEPGGKKDDQNKTVPRSLRHFPYKTASGGLDLPHLRNALARIPQSDVPANKKASLTKRAQKILADANKNKERSAFVVVKERDGSYRWFASSSNAYKDNDQEIVSTKALASDCDRMDVAGDYGPLRWWHMGDLNSGVDVGTCDFNAMNGRMLIESGTFRDATVAQALLARAKELGVSVGFTHPTSEPAGGVYEHIRRFERSVLPRAAAANPYTSFDVNKESDSMATMQEKWKEFVSLFNGDEAQARKYVSANLDTQKEIEQAGVKHKEAAAAQQPQPAPAPAAAQQPQQQQLDQQAQAALNAVDPIVAAMVSGVKEAAAKGAGQRGAMFASMRKAGTYDEEKARGGAQTAPAGATPPPASVPPPAQPTQADQKGAAAPGAACKDDGVDGADGAEPDGDEGEPATIEDILADLLEYVLNSKELKDRLTQEIGAQLQAVNEARTKEASEVTKQLAALNKRVKELEGDAPERPMFRASTDASTVLAQNSRLKEQSAQPYVDPLTREVLSGLFQGNGVNGQQQ